MKKTTIALIVTSLLNSIILDAMGLTLESALSIAYQTNPEIAALVAKADFENSNIGPQYSLDNPRLSLMRENNVYPMFKPALIM